MMSGTTGHHRANNSHAALSATLAGTRIPFSSSERPSPSLVDRMTPGVPLPSAKRIGATDPFYPKAAHPARFTQRQHDRTGVAVYDSADRGGPQSLASIAAAEQASRRLFAAASQNNCSQLKHVLVMLDAAQADASRVCCEKNGVDAQAALETVTFTVRLPTPMTDLVAHRLINGQVRSWEVELLQRCQRDPKRIEAIVVDAPINAAPIVGEDRYILGISETYPITKQNRTIHFDAPVVSAGVAPGGRLTLDLPLTLAQVESVAWFAACLDHNPTWEGAAERIVYIFRTREPHGYVPGLLFFFVSSGCCCTASRSSSSDKEDCHAPQDADRFLVLDATQCGTDDCFEFLALKCTPMMSTKGGCNGSVAEEACRARRARIFDPFDQECRFPRCGRFACQCAPVLPRMRARLRVSLPTARLLPAACARRHRVFRLSTIWLLLPRVKM
jgi:hypothetical protein